MRYWTQLSNYAMLVLFKAMTLGVKVVKFYLFSLRVDPILHLGVVERRES